MNDQSPGTPVNDQSAIAPVQQSSPCSSREPSSEVSILGGLVAALKEEEVVAPLKHENLVSSPKQSTSRPTVPAEEPLAKFEGAMDFSLYNSVILYAGIKSHSTSDDAGMNLHFEKEFEIGTYVSSPMMDDSAPKPAPQDFFIA